MPTHVKIQIISAKRIQSHLQASRSVRVMCIPQLASDEYLFTEYATIFDPLSYFLLIPVNESSINVPISIFQCECDCLSNDPRF